MAHLPASRPARRLAALTALAAALAVAAPLLATGPAFAQGKPDVKIAIIASKTGPLEAYAKQTIVGFQMGLEYATGGTMAVGGRRLVVIEKDDQGKPDVGKAQLAAAYADDKVDIAVGPTGQPRGAGHAAGGRGVQEDPARGAGGGRLHHRRQVEQVHLPHRPQLQPGRHLQRRGAGQARAGAGHAGAGQRLRPRRRQGLQGGGEEGEVRARGVRARPPPPTSRPPSSASSTR
jgi:hypothetical protein